MQFGWTATKAASFQIFSTAYEAGINFIDTADIYSRWAPDNPGGVAESIIGEWMKKNKVPRERIILATKVRGVMGGGPNDEGLSRTHIIKAVEGSLTRLQTDYIDLYQTHWYDELTPVEETLSVFDDLIHQGKVRYAGCSNYPAWRLVESLWAADKKNYMRFESVQPHYSLVHRAEFERELSEVCQIYRLGVLPYSPLAAGFLTGKYRRDGDPVNSARLPGAQRYFGDRNWALLDVMGNLAKAKGSYSVSQIALGWLLSDPLVTSPIIGPRTLEQLQDNLGAAGLRLTADEKLILDEASDWREKKL
jgi:aryl-alcohol dehydrogenase-like predicted oxidoreductase